ncbi:hypothetical protein [Saccharomonospora sp.]|uniref:hypothetical protein n=1 Tax=Saccharomonospora sp. TaxID=33913 RepID=UPI0026147E0A|nr:hypothetical protein [Saccharomonospora sp.]
MDSLANRIAAIGGVVAGGTIIVLGLVLGWATWVWLPFAAVLATVTVVVLRSALHERELNASTPLRQHVPPPTPVPPSGPTPRRETISELPLPSQEQDYRFLFSATVLWERQPHVPAMTTDFGAAAKQFVITRAAGLTQQHHPEDSTMATTNLSSYLAERQQVVNGHYVWATDVTLKLSTEDSERLARMAKLRKDRALWEQERAHELSLRDYIGKEVLRDPGTAVLWWFARNLQDPDGLTKTVNDIEKLRRLTSAAHATHVPPWDQEPFTPPHHENGQASLFTPPAVVEGTTAEPDPTLRLVDAVEQLTDNTEPALRSTLHRRLVQLFHAQGLTATADEIARRFDVVVERPTEDVDRPSETDGRSPDSGEDRTPNGDRSPGDDEQPPGSDGEPTDSLPHPPPSL